MCVAWAEKATPEALGGWLLRRDPVGSELPDSARAELVRAALCDGEAVGTALRAAYPGLAPDRIAAVLGIRVSETDEDPWAGPFLRHADYRAKPPEIRVFRSAVAALEAQIDFSLRGADVRGNRAGRALADFAASLWGKPLASVFVAHELYHHMEATRVDPPLQRRHAVTRLRVGLWHWNASIHALSEIAAGSCAQALLALAHHPALLDKLVLSRFQSFSRTPSGGPWSRPWTGASVARQGRSGSWATSDIGGAHAARILNPG